MLRQEVAHADALDPPAFARLHQCAPGLLKVNRGDTGLAAVDELAEDELLDGLVEVCVGQDDQSSGFKGALRAVSGQYAEQILQEANGNVSLAARRLGVSRTPLYRALNQRVSV